MNYFHLQSGQMNSDWLNAMLEVAGKGLEPIQLVEDEYDTGLLPPKDPAKFYTTKPKDALDARLENADAGLLPPEGMGYEEAVPYSQFYRGDPANGVEATVQLPFLEGETVLQPGRVAPAPLYGQNMNTYVPDSTKIQSGVVSSPHVYGTAVVPPQNNLSMPPVGANGVQYPQYNPPQMNATGTGAVGKWVAEHKSGVTAGLGIAQDTINFINKQAQINAKISTLQSQAKAAEMTAKGNWANAGVDAMGMRLQQAHAASSQKASAAGSGIALNSQSVQAVMNTTTSSFERDMAVNSANALNQYNQTRYQAKVARWQAKQLDSQRGVGQFIGSTVGAVAGAYFGMPQVGAALGGAAGGFLDR